MARAMPKPITVSKLTEITVKMSVWSSAECHSPLDSALV